MAQFKKGTLMLGTNLASTAYSSASSDYDYDNGEKKTTGTKSYSLSMGPQVGVFLLPNLVFGGSFAFTLSGSQAISNSQNTNSTFSGSKANTTTSTVSLGPFIRYYFAGIPDRNWFYFQGNAAAGAGSGSSSGNSYTSTTTATSNGSISNIFNWNAGGSVGMTHFYYKRIGMDLALGYNYSHTHNYNINSTNTTTIASGKTTASGNNYTLNTGTNGLTLGLSFHWYL